MKEDLKTYLEEKYTVTQDKINENDLPQIDKRDLALAITGVPFSFLLIIISVILTVAIGIGVIALIYHLEGFLIGRVHIGLLAMIAVGLILIICVSIKGLITAFTDRGTFEVAMPITEEQSSLKKDIEEVCSRLDIPTPKNILISFNPTFYVTEAPVKTPDKKYKGRTLVIGALYLRYLTSLEIKSIISHEMAHFTGRDTVFSLYVAPLYISIRKIIGGLREYSNSGSLALYLPMLPLIVVLKMFYLKYAKVEARISREREMRADYIATLLYGANTFKSALTKVINLDTVFSSVYKQDFVNVIKMNKMFDNYFSYFNSNLNSDKLLNGELIEKDTTDLYDSHCSATERFEYIPKINNDSHENLYPEDQYTDVEKFLTEAMGYYTTGNLVAYSKHLKEQQERQLKAEQKALKEAKKEEIMDKMLPYICDILCIVALVFLFRALGINTITDGVRYSVMGAVLLEIILLSGAQPIPKGYPVLFLLGILHNPFVLIGTSWSCWAIINIITIPIIIYCLVSNHTSTFYSE